MFRKILIGSALLLSIGSVPPVAAEDDDHGGGHWGGHHGGGHHWGHGGHSNFGFYFGAPLLWGSSYYDRPYYPRSYYDRPYYPRSYYEPRTVIIEREPPVYVQRPATPPTQVAQLWYYCPNPAGYYPHVPNCSQDWVPVDPSNVPPSPSR